MAKQALVVLAILATATSALSEPIDAWLDSLKPDSRQHCAKIINQNVDVHKNDFSKDIIALLTDMSASSERDAVLFMSRLFLSTIGFDSGPALAEKQRWLNTVGRLFARLPPNERTLLGLRTFGLMLNVALEYAPHYVLGNDLNYPQYTGRLTILGRLLDTHEAITLERIKTEFEDARLLTFMEQSSITLSSVWKRLTQGKL